MLGVTELHSWQGIGDDDETVASSSKDLMETDEGFQPVFFEPRGLHNLGLVDELESLCPLTDMKVRVQDFVELCSGG